MSKTPYGTYAFQEALKQLRQLKPDLVYACEYAKQGTVFNSFLIAKNRTRFRPLGVLDWAHFTMAGLRVAIQYDVLNEYYVEMLKDPRSPSNTWKNTEKENSLKEQYSHSLGESHE
mgnify:CR=1 FL=1|tara:strand:- start:1192 stop:1539 length:348 start_codon:yes stop_codon:yes gene_type:complete